MIQIQIDIETLEENDGDMTYLSTAMLILLFGICSYALLVLNFNSGLFSDLGIDIILENN